MMTRFVPLLACATLLLVLLAGVAHGQTYAQGRALFDALYNNKAGPSCRRGVDGSQFSAFVSELCTPDATFNIPLAGLSMPMAAAGQVVDALGIEALMSDPQGRLFFNSDKTRIMYHSEVVFFMKDAKASGCDVHVDSRLISLGLQDGKWSELSEAVRPAGAICQQTEDPIITAERDLLEARMKAFYRDVDTTTENNNDLESWVALTDKWLSEDFLFTGIGPVMKGKSGFLGFAKANKMGTKGRMVHTVTDFYLYDHNTGRFRVKVSGVGACGQGFNTDGMAEVSFDGEGRLLSLDYFFADDFVEVFTALGACFADPQGNKQEL